VHLVELKGSAPRVVGAQMLVSVVGIVGTMGGGELERTATLEARELLQAGRAGILRLALGPQLNQCCGGSVTLAFEPFAPADLAWIRKLTRAAEEPTAVFRTVRIDRGGGLRRDWFAGDGTTEPPFAATLGDDGATFRELVNPQPQAFWLFGAGHVGRAVAYAVAPLGFHPLDEAICEAVLRRNDFAYLGLIGSATKRARFVKRLGEAGIPREQLKRLVCPIGLPDIESKEPAAIAASFVADLLMRRERHLLHAGAAALHG
jgi:xanthine dehydrogenase accessory factor